MSDQDEVIEIQGSTVTTLRAQRVTLQDGTDVLVLAQGEDELIPGFDELKPTVIVEIHELGDTVTGDGTGEKLPEVDGSSYPPDATPLD